MFFYMKAMTTGSGCPFFVKFKIDFSRFTSYLREGVFPTTDQRSVVHSSPHWFGDSGAIRCIVSDTNAIVISKKAMSARIHKRLRLFSAFAESAFKGVIVFLPLFGGKVKFFTR